MDGVIDMDRARELVADAALWPRVRDFLWDFAPSVHPSWIEPQPGAPERLLSADADVSAVIRSSPRFKRYILESLGVGPLFHDFPKEDRSRLLLLDGATLLEIARWLGALAYAQDLRRVTDGATVRRLKEELPGVYPDVFGFTAYFGGLEAWRPEGADGAAPAGPVVAKTGCAMLASALSALPEALFERFRLKLPKGILDGGSPAGGAAGPRNVQASVAKLLKLKFPEAHSLCCS